MNNIRPTGNPEKRFCRHIPVPAAIQYSEILEMECEWYEKDTLGNDVVSGYDGGVGDGRTCSRGTGNGG